MSLQMNTMIYSSTQIHIKIYWVKVQKQHCTKALHNTEY